MRFIIRGNQENPLGNPMGYMRTTYRSKWTKKYGRYRAWKSYVWVSLCSEYLEKPRYIDKVFCDIRIWYVDNRRSDPDNILKGIIDSLSDYKSRLYTHQRLWPTDRNVVGRVIDFDFDKENPRVEVEIQESDWRELHHEKYNSS